MPWVFVGFLTLFTAQVALIRNGRADIHRRLGVAGAALAGLMLVLGPATAIIVDAGRYAMKGTTPLKVAHPSARVRLDDESHDPAHPCRMKRTVNRERPILAGKRKKGNHIQMAHFNWA